MRQLSTHREISNAPLLIDATIIIIMDMHSKIVNTALSHPVRSSCELLMVASLLHIRIGGYVLTVFVCAKPAGVR